jgi:glycosyltransferase involved in cell wall biosynthesis
MRILYCTHEQFYPLTGGGSAGTFYLVKKLVERDHSVTIMSPLYAKKKPVEAAYKVKLKPFSPFYMHRSARLLSLRYSLYSILFTFPLLKTVLLNKYDVIICRNFVLSVPVIISSLFTKAKICLYYTDFLTSFMKEAKQLPSWLLGMIAYFEKKIALFFNKIFVITPLMKYELIKHGISHKKIKVVYDGVDTALFKPLKKKLDKEIVIFHGSLEPYHGIDNFIKIINETIKLKSSILFLIIGRGNSFSYLKEKLGNKNVKVLEFIPHHIIPEYIAMSKVGVIPYQPSENLNMVLTLKLLEYLAMGKPVVSFRLKSVEQIFGKYKFMYLSDSIEEFAGNIIKALNSKRSEESARLINKKFSWDKVAIAVSEEIEKYGSKHSQRLEPVLV